VPRFSPGRTEPFGLPVSLLTERMTGASLRSGLRSLSTSRCQTALPEKSDPAMSNGPRRGTSMPRARHASPLCVARLRKPTPVIDGALTARRPVTASPASRGCTGPVFVSSTEDDIMGQHQNGLDRCSRLVSAGKLAEAVRLAERAVECHPEDGDLWQFLGQVRHRLGKLAGAQSALETASLLVPLEPPARRALADCYARTGHPSSAADLYRDARCPTDLLPSVASGLGGLGEYGAALEVCRELIRRATRATSGWHSI
jgi:tetratricopeptide repeat protein